MGRVFYDGKVQTELKYISDELEKESGTIFPLPQQVFRTFYLTRLEQLTGVIIGQDPYHNGSAVGLCFSVKPGNSINPSLRNIYKELEDEGFHPKRDGDLTNWARQGILLLNMALTVRKGDADSHSCLWDVFSELLIKFIDKKRCKKVHWLLFGSNAHAIEKHLSGSNIHKTTHPSPFAAATPSRTAPAFFGSKIFHQVPNVKW